MKKNLVIGLTVCIITITAAPLKLVNNHQGNAVIILPAKAILTEKFAADELQYHIERATGAKLPIQLEGSGGDDGKYRIYLGNTEAARNAGLGTDDFVPSGYIIKTEDNRLFLLGKDRVRRNIGSHFAADWQGTLFAVYDFLENELGVHWLWPGQLGEVIPKRNEIIVGDISRRGKPYFRSTRLQLRRDRPGQLLGWSSVANREAYKRDQQVFLLRHRISATIYSDYGHAFTNYWERFGKTHPEYFFLLPNGKREPLEGDATGHDIGLCVSQPKLWEQIIADWQRSPQRNPDNIPYRPYLNACENDVPGMCVCATCRSWDADDPAFAASPYWSLQKGYPLRRRGRFMGLAKVEWGEDGVLPAGKEPPSVSDRYARFYLELLKKAREIDPNAKVVGYAYANYRRPPQNVAMDPDVIISFVPSLYYPYTEKLSQTFQEDWLGWRERGTREFIYRPNYMLSGANLPVLFTRQIARDIAFAAKNGAIATYFDSLTGVWANQGPMLYTLARLQQFPEKDPAEILDEYYAGFGKAAREVRAYFDYWTARSDAVDADTFRKYCLEERDNAGNYAGTFKNFVLLSHRLFPPESFAEGYKLLEAAKNAAAGDADASARVDFLYKGLKDAELTVAVRQAQKTMELQPTPDHKKAFAKAFQTMAEYRAGIEKDNVCNFFHAAYWERVGAGWPWKIAKISE